MVSPGQKKIAVVLASILIAVEVGVFGLAKPANAIVPGAVPVYDTATAQVYGLDKTNDIIRVGVVGAAMTALINSVNYMAQRLAYDTAEQISEGNFGKTPLFNYSNWGDYMKDVGDGALGEFIGTMNQSGLAPFNLCDPNNAGLLINFALGLIGDVQPPKPKCSWNQIKNNYKTFGQRVKTGEALKQFGVAFEPGQSGLGVGVQSSSRVLSDIGKKENAALQARLEGQGFTSVTEMITGKIKTPSQVVKEKALEGTKEGERAQGISYDAMGKAITAAPGAIAASAMNTFVTHLVAKLLKKALGGGLYYSLADATCYLGITGCGGVNDANYNSAAGTSQINSQNSDLITPPLQQDSHYAPLDEFSTCPDESRGINNCVLDSQFSAALSRGATNGKYLTVQEALDQGYLHGDWPLISNSEAHRARNADPYCFSNAYCYSNLVKLRKHRILPVGWELAAAKSPADPAKLSEVVAKFDDCPTAKDPDPGRHPWCHLIDPNWVIKLPVTQCRLRVNGPTLLSTEAPTRAQYCADTPSCVAEDKYGNCIQGYGYCTREKNIWRLGGTECQAPYASCAQFASRLGDSLLALQNTIDHGVCNADNVGCRGYNLTRNATNTAEWFYTPGTDRVFLNKNAVECDAADAGCTRLIAKNDLRRNLVLNPSFEEPAAENFTQYPKYWGDIPWNNQAVWGSDSANAHGGTHAVIPLVLGNTGPEEQVAVEPDQTYTLSYYAKQDDSSQPGQAEVHVWLLAKKGNNNYLEQVDFPAEFSSCNPGTHGNLKTVYLPLKPTGSDWIRTSCTFVTPPNGYKLNGTVIHPGGIVLALGREQAPKVWIDDLQLEEGSYATTYRDSAYENGIEKTLKIPPAHLNCTGNSAKDSPSCAAYAPVCRADEVGCERYDPADGGTPITAVVAQGDYCPAECVGYQTFRQEVSLYDPPAYPRYFIPKTATQCSNASAGCTEFTNLEITGGEAREYFSYLRPCEKPNGGLPTFYTWEGSDTTGYQLKEWHLKEGKPLSGEQGFPPAVTSDYSPSFCTKAIFQAGYNPDCREFYDVSGNASYRLYTKTIVVTDNCAQYRITKPPAAPAATTEAACAQVGAGYHWQAASNSCLACEAIGGAWQEGSSECLFLGYREESSSCAAAENGCRLYTGNDGGNVQIVFTEDFEGYIFKNWQSGKETAEVSSSTESTIVGGHSLRVKGATTAFRTITTSTLGALTESGIYSIKFWAKGPSGKFEKIQLVNPKNNQTVSFLASAAGADLDGNWHAYSFGPVILPFDPNDSLSGGLVNAVFQANINASQYWYLDNVELTKIGSAVAVVKDSWKTPDSCDRNSSGEVLPQAQLGCAAYTDHKQNAATLKSFDRLCRDAAVGCSAFIDTRNSNFSAYEYWNLMAVNKDGSGNPLAVGASTEVKGPTGETLCTIAPKNASCRYHQTSTLDAPSVPGSQVKCARQGSGPCYIDETYICDVPAGANSCSAAPSDLVTVLPDRTVYVVDDEKWSCDSSQTGCTEAGLPAASVCRLASACVPTGGGTTCGCSQNMEVCVPNLGCGMKNQFVCSVAAGQTSCNYALPAAEPYRDLSYTRTNLILNPQKYDDQICTGNAVGCESWHSSNKNAPSLSYFKNPDGRFCEYRENVVFLGVNSAGYFKQGTDEPCDPNFLIDGNYYGIRKSADVNYLGFVGDCPAEQAGCTEYIDPLDRQIVKKLNNAEDLSEPKRYYYIKDQSIDYGSCNGQFSFKDGCVLLNDTSDQNLNYSAAGAENESESKASKLVPVKPGICQFRIGCYQVSGSSQLGDLKPARVKIFKDQEEETTFGDQALNVANSDYYKNGLKGDEIKQICQDNQLVITAEEIGCYNDADCVRGTMQGACRQDRKDSNAVIKVARDRVCGAWYACKSSSPQWDPRTNSFREICDEIGLCDESSVADASSPTVDVTSCKHWLSDDNSKQILSENLYTKRDVSWTGMDYSGYAVPHMYPASALSQLSTDKFCSWGNKQKKCQSSADCVYLKTAYPCVTQNSLGHDVGICDASDGGDCASALKGVCEQKHCLSSGNDIGACNVADGAECTVDAKGTCYQHRCYFSPFGNTDPATADAPQPLGTAPEKQLPISCRAYPEVDSPVPSDVVLAWNNTSAADPNLPAKVRQGFQSANYCENGNDCECSYKKVSYKDQSVPKYYGLYNNATIKGICNGGTYDGMVCDPNLTGLDPYKKRTDKILSCTDEDVDKGQPLSATCIGVRRTDVVRGLEGYCLEEDQVTSIYGRDVKTPGVSARACLTWLPIDRLSGQADLFNANESATYEFNDSYMCLIPQRYKTIGPYGLGNDNVDVGAEGDDGALGLNLDGTGGNLGMFVGCVSCNGGDDDVCPSIVEEGFPDGNKDTLMSRERGNPFLDCPPDTGFIVVDSDPYANDNWCPDAGGTEDNKLDKDLCSHGDDNYKYFCVPWGSVHVNLNNGLFGKECTPADLIGQPGMVRASWLHGPCASSVEGLGPWRVINETINTMNQGEIGVCDSNVIPRFNANYWPETNSPRDWAKRTGNPDSWNLKDGDGTPVIAMNNGEGGASICNGAMARMIDCWKFDAPVSPNVYTGTDAHATKYNVAAVDMAIKNNLLPAGSPKGSYLGCSVLAKVTKQGSQELDTNKAHTDWLGGHGTAAPPGSFKLATKNPLEMSYTWQTDPTPFGLGALRNPADFPNGRSFSLPVETTDVAKQTDKTKPYLFITITDGTVPGNICDGGGLCYSYGTGGKDDSASPGKYNQAAGYMHQLFAKAYDYFGWSTAVPKSGDSGLPKGYVPLPEYLQGIDNKTYLGATVDTLKKDINLAELYKDKSIDTITSFNVPKIYGVEACDIDNHCMEKEEGTFTLNNLQGGDIVGGGGWKRATVKFFGDAGADTEPIRQVEVLWNINSKNIKPQKYLGWYKNHRGYYFNSVTGSRSSKCDRSDFGTTGDACDDSAPFTFVHNYTCNAASPHCEDGTDGCWDPNYIGFGQSQGRPACVYKPAVYVLNNWGLCLGRCGDNNSPGGQYCSNNGGTGSTINNGSWPQLGDPNNKIGSIDECEISKTNLVDNKNQPFIPYSGNVVVYPGN